MRSTIERAKAENGVSAVYTFHPHPTFVTHPQSPKPIIISKVKKYEIIKNLGIDVVIEQQFDEKFSEKSPVEFVEFLEKIFPTLSCIFVGSNFRFGHHGSGNTDALSALCSKNNIAVVIVPTVMLDGQRVSSTRIRQALIDRDLTKVERMLGRKYHDNAL
jgi:riboflavin kinase/FMN adenylyltransferase